MFSVPTRYWEKKKGKQNTYQGKKDIVNQKEISKHQVPKKERKMK